MPSFIWRSCRTIRSDSTIPTLTYSINHLGTVALANKCAKAGVTRFVYTSSCSVYGTGSGEYKNEQSETNPQTAYAKCKTLVERDVSAMASDDFSPTFLRNATAYGASPHMRFDLVLNNLAGLAWTTKEIKMTSDGTPWRPLVHVRDIAHAIACTLEAPRHLVHKEIFNVGSTSENYRSGRSPRSLPTRFRAASSPSDAAPKRSCAVRASCARPSRKSAALPSSLPLPCIWE